MEEQQNRYIWIVGVPKALSANVGAYSVSTFLSSGTITTGYHFVVSYPDSSETMTLSALQTLTNSYPTFETSKLISDGPGGKMWYLVKWMPHRYGLGTNDNSNYGLLILIPMVTTTSRTIYYYHKSGSDNSWSSAFTDMMASFSFSGNTLSITGPA